MLNETKSSTAAGKVDLSRAESITVTDFSAALSSGVLRAIDARRLPGIGGKVDFRPWIWAGWIIGDGPLPGQFDPGQFNNPGGQG